MPTVVGILETSLYVEDMGRAVAFYQTIFAFPTILSTERLTAFRVAERDVLLIFKQGGSLNLSATDKVKSTHDGTGPIHLAFATAASELDHWRTWLAQHDVAIESETEWDSGSHSLYFRDPDQHLLELVTPGIWSMSW
jgi:catechol 2,3-dioxygenase-like lactoylglutathione lyase family enzyme